MKHIYCILFSAFFACLPVCLPAASVSKISTDEKPWISPYKLPPVYPPAHVHPRLMFRQQDISRIQQNMQMPEETAAYEVFSKDPADTNAHASFIPRAGKSFTFNGAVLEHIENAALHYALGKEKKFADYAYQSFLNCCRTYTTDGIYDVYRPAGQMMLTAAEIYDWCYDALSDKQKLELISQALLFAKQLQVSCPPSKQGAVVGHGCESQILRNYLAFAIAVYDERPDIWNYTAGRFYQEYVPARRFYYQTGLPSFQGSNYGPYRTIFDLWSVLLITRAGLSDPYEGTESQWNDAFLYYQRPDSQMWRTGDDTGEHHTPYGMSSYTSNAFFSSCISGNAAVKAFAAFYTKDFQTVFSNSTGESDDTYTPAQFLLFNNPAVIPLQDKNMSLVRYNNSPLGEYFARGSWTDSSTPAVHMKIGELNSGNHEHRDGGSFEIFCGSILASDSGYYTSGGGSSGYSAPEVQIYYHGTISHNCLLVEPAKITEKDYGGQKTVQESATLSAWQSDADSIRGKVTAHCSSMQNSGTGYVFLAGDLTNAYEHADSVQRSMLAVFTGRKDMPLTFFVYDTVLPQKDARAVFLLHCQQEPSVSAEHTVLCGTEGTKLVCTTLLPVHPDTTLIGGSGRNYIVAGKNYEPAVTISRNSIAETGWGRIEIRDTDSTKTVPVTRFLHAMTAVTEKLSDTPQAILLHPTGFDGAYTAGYAAFFAQTPNIRKLVADIPDTGGAQVSVFVCGLAPGKWQLDKQIFEISAECRMLTCSIPGGTHIILQKQ